MANKRRLCSREPSLKPPSGNNQEEWVRIRSSKINESSSFRIFLRPVGFDTEEPAAEWTFTIDQPSTQLRFGLSRRRSESASATRNLVLCSYPPRSEDEVEIRSISETTQSKPELIMRYCNSQDGAKVTSKSPQGPYTISSTRKFPTFATKNVSLTHGQWYYEFDWERRAPSCPQIGWADASSGLGDGHNRGVGDESKSQSWGFDPQRVMKWNNGSEKVRPFRFAW